MKKGKSVSFPLALRFMIILAAAMLFLSVLFVTFLRQSVTSRQNADLKESCTLIYQSVLENGFDGLIFLNLPYYITFVVYETESQDVIFTNDSLLPLLSSEGKTRTYFEKDFFTDGDLNIRYITKELVLDEERFTVECALDIANDSASGMISALPALVLVALIPVLGISFLLAFFISQQTENEVKKLREDYDREKAFTSNVSHELKTPIAIIDGHANLIKRWGKDDKAQLEESVDVILRETQNMSDVVTTLLELSRLEQGKVKIEKTDFSVTGFFEKLKDEFKALGNGNCENIFIEPVLYEADLKIRTDEQKLHQVFTIIITNSLKFAGEDCKITLSAKKVGNKIELCATDNGTGFEEEDLPFIFERFYKGDKAHTHDSAKKGGAGLGLSIARTLVEVLGGSILAENSQDGGAKVRVLFPNA